MHTLFRSQIQTYRKSSPGLISLRWWCSIRGVVSHLRTNALSISTPPSISRGFVAVLASSDEHQFDIDDLLGGGKFLGKADLVWQDGALQNIRLGGTTTLEGDLDLRGHRLLNFDLGTRGLDHVEVKDVHTLSSHHTKKRKD